MIVDGELPILPGFDQNSEAINDYIEKLYSVFLDELVRTPLPWKETGQTVSIRRQPEADGRHGVFWHIVSGGNGPEPERRIEHQRCIRLRWLRKIVELFNSEYPEERIIRWWIDTKRSSSPRYVITRQDFDYIVVIEQRPTYALLITAYFVERSRRRTKLKQEHDKFWQEQEPPTS